MRIDLHVKCVLQKVSMFREMIDCFGFAKTQQGCETNDIFCEAATFFSCFTVLRHKELGSAFRA
jgi:hypothetical protein